MKSIKKLVASIVVLTMIFGILPGIKVDAAEKKVIVKNQKELTAALKNRDVVQINIETKN